VKVVPVDFRTVVRIIASRWKVVVIALAACLAGAVAITAVQTKVYQASATILVSVSGAVTVPDAYAATQAAQQRLSSYAEIAGSRLVAQRAIDQLHVPLTAEQLIDSTKVSYTPESTLFRLSVTDTDPQRAAALASAMADSFAAVVPEVDPRVQLSQPADPMVGSSFATEQTTAAAKATVVEEPTVPQHAVSPVPVRNAALGLIAGLVLGVALALIREATDRTVRGRDKLAAGSAVPVLAELPPPSKPDVASGHTHARAKPNDLVFDEAIRGLRTRLAGASSTQPSSFLVTAPAVGDGATTTALNLALSFTKVDETVLLIEGDPRKATIAKLLDVESRFGMADLIADDQLIDDAIHPTSHDGLWILAATGPAEFGRQLSRASLKATLQKLAANFDRVVIDGPPAFVAADAGIFAGAVDAAVLVVRSGKTTIDEVEGALENLCTAGGKVVGTVLTDTSVPRHTRAAVVAYRGRAVTAARG
jgi:capsular exopolysaccharide synthesis family protein